MHVNGSLVLQFTHGRTETRPRSIRGDGTVCPVRAQTGHLKRHEINTHNASSVAAVDATGRTSGDDVRFK